MSRREFSDVTMISAVTSSTVELFDASVTFGEGEAAWSGGTYEFDIYSEEGTFSKVVSMTAVVLPPTGGTLGSHTLDIITTQANVGMFLYATAPYNKDIRFSQMNFVGDHYTNKQPADPSSQAVSLQSMRFSDEFGLRFKYINNIDVHHTGKLIDLFFILEKTRTAQSV